MVLGATCRTAVDMKVYSQDWMPKDLVSISGDAKQSGQFLFELSVLFDDRDGIYSFTAY